MNCKLCGEPKELCDSHIISEFFYTPIYDSKHRLPMMMTSAEIDNDLLQKGIREELLCKDCEQKFYEGYVKNILYGTRKALSSDHWKLERFGSYVVIIIDNIDYTKFKIFQMSVLWRAGVASGKMWEPVQLGDKHEKKLRAMLLNGDPGEPEEYGCVMMGIINDRKDLSHFITSPEVRIIDGHRFYQFVFGGFIWAFLVTGHTFKSSLKMLFLQKNTPLFAPRKSIYDMEYLRTTAEELVKNKKLPIFSGNTVISVDSRNK